MTASPDLNALRLFATVARHLNFRRAAAEIGMSAANLSERIRELESALGVRLFNRTTRSVALSEAGAALLDRIGPALTTIGDALADAGVFGREVVGTIRINGPMPAIDFRLMPLVDAFMAQHPAVRFEIFAEEALVDIVAAGFDAGIRYGEHLAQDMIAVSLGGPQRLLVVGAPDYFARHGRPQHPNELAQHRCLTMIFPRGNRLPWNFEKDGEEIDFLPSAPLVGNRGTVLLSAAKAGVGLTMMFEEYCADDLASGALVPVLEAWTPPFPGPFLYYPERRLMPAAFRAFVDFVKMHAVHG
ncbi:LysR family transcriptional regulator [Zavarzinia sp.]|uniref:LysR family transcriptional regulator n=1 Tax=Zavarzinia sp. TaxID=2027920 RepID=UPI0035640208